MDVPISVKCLLEQIKMKLEPPFSSLCVVGEVSNFRGLGKHWYFTLKEEGATIQCAVWAGYQRFVKCSIENGRRVQVNGSLNLYIAGGTLTLVVTNCVPAGIGDFRARLLQLEAELRAMGLFDRPKKPIPRFPRRIGIIAAIGGAALWDVIRVTGRRYPGANLLVAPAAAQGERAVTENVAALQEIQDPFWACDVVLMVRGGGSLEDLWSYNDPTLVNAVADCRLPVVTGIGHEIDFTLVDLAADLRAATPSQAAELVTPDRRQTMDKLICLQEALVNRMGWRLHMAETTLNLLVDSKGMRSLCEHMSNSVRLLERLNRDIARCEVFKKYSNKLYVLVQRLHLAHPSRRLDLVIGCLNLICQRLLYIAADLGSEASAPRFALAKSRLCSAIGSVFDLNKSKLSAANARIQSMNPKGPLELGFALVMDANGRLLTRSKSVPKNSKVTLCWLDGSRQADLAD